MSNASGRSGVMKEAKSRVYVLTESLEFIGFLHLINLDRRESDVINDDKRFIHLTEVEVRDKVGKKKTKVPFAAINKQSIVCVIPMGDREEEPGV